MNSLERIRAAVTFHTPDRVPVIGQVFGHAATLADIPLEKYIQNGEVLADCQLQALEFYGYDAVFALMDVHVEAEAAGSVLEYRPGQYPFVSSHALAEGASLSSLSVPDPRIDGRMPQLLKAAEILRDRVGDDVLVVGCVAGPMTLAIQLLGIENALYLAADDPEEFARLLAFSAEVITVFGAAQIEAGVHLPVVFDPSASPAIIPPQFFREFELPLLTKIFKSFKEAGAELNWLHITGPTEKILSYYPDAGVDIANIDYCVESGTATKVLPHTCIDGNIKPLLFLEERPDSVEKEAAELLNLFSGRGGYILSPGCEIPPEAKPENIMRLVSAVHKN